MEDREPLFPTELSGAKTELPKDTPSPNDPSVHCDPDDSPPAPLELATPESISATVVANFDEPARTVSEPRTPQPESSTPEAELQTPEPGRSAPKTAPESGTPSRDPEPDTPSRDPGPDTPNDSRISDSENRPSSWPSPGESDPVSRLPPLSGKSHPIPRRMSWREEFSSIPPAILYNPHVAKRLNIYPTPKGTPPRAALSHAEYRSRSAPRSSLDELSQRLFDGHDPSAYSNITTDELKTCSAQLKTFERDLIDKSLYLEAKKAADAYDRCIFALRNGQEKQKMKMSLNEMMCKRDKLLSLVSDTRADYLELLKAHDQRTAEHLEVLKSEQDRELSGFEAGIPADLTPNFKRYSVTYLAMRSKERNLALNRQFNKAQALKAKADTLEEQEREANFERMDLFYRDRKARMKERHEVAVQNFMEYNNSKRAEIELRRDRAINGHLARASLIEKQIQILTEANVEKSPLPLKNIPEVRGESRAVETAVETTENVLIGNEEEELPDPEGGTLV
jgi:hypothetical protein